MAVVIENVELSKTTVQINEQVSLAVTIVHNSYLSHFQHSALSAYTHSQLNQRGTTNGA